MEPGERQAALDDRAISRVEAFSDGVFAFAATLLVLGVRMPRPGDAGASAGLAHLLLAQWPSYLTFALTFAVVGIVWANHRLAFSHLVRSDHTMVSLNLLELMAVAFLPVPTAVLGAWIGDDRNRLAAVLFYGGTLVLLGLFHNLLWWYAAYPGRLTAPDFSTDKRRVLTITWVGGPVLYGLCLVLALIDPRLSIAGFVLVHIAFLLPTPRVLMQARRARELRRSH